ncbi:MAG: hypothetical protein ABR906_12410 [Terracidiphilus sp.]
MLRDTFCAGKVTPEKRSEIMARVRAKDTHPEMAVRKLIFASGYRYRLHERKLPGCPDLIFRSRRKVIFVHGCFWHRHTNCALARIPVHASLKIEYAKCGRPITPVRPGF